MNDETLILNHMHHSPFEKELHQDCPYCNPMNFLQRTPEQMKVYSSCQRHNDRRGWLVVGSLVWTRLCLTCKLEYELEWDPSAVLAMDLWQESTTLDLGAGLG